MIREILTAFQGLMTSGLGLTPTKARPVYGLPVATRPSAQIGVTGFGPGSDGRISDNTPYGRILTITLYIYATSDAQLLDYLDTIDTLYSTIGTFAVGVTEVAVTWGQAVVPEAEIELETSKHYQIQQPVTFTWE